MLAGKFFGFITAVQTGSPPCSVTAHHIHRLIIATVAGNEPVLAVRSRNNQSNGIHHFHGHHSSHKSSYIVLLVFLNQYPIHLAVYITFATKGPDLNFIIVSPGIYQGQAAPVNEPLAGNPTPSVIIPVEGAPDVNLPKRSA
jgi:hypothetical protein